MDSVGLSAQDAFRVRRGVSDALKQEQWRRNHLESMDRDGQWTTSRRRRSTRLGKDQEGSDEGSDGEGAATAMGAEEWAALARRMCDARVGVPFCSGLVPNPIFLHSPQPTTTIPQRKKEEDPKKKEEEEVKEEREQ